MCDHSSRKSVLKRILELDREDNDVIPTKAAKDMPEKPPVVVLTRRIVTKITKMTTLCECNYAVTYQKYLYNGKNSSVRPISSITENYKDKSPITVHTKRELEITEKFNHDRNN